MVGADGCERLLSSGIAGASSVLCFPHLRFVAAALAVPSARRSPWQ
jgi:hypothetical protein